MKKDLLTLSDVNASELKNIIFLAMKIKKKPYKFLHKLEYKNIILLFEKPSLRTRLSFEVGMKELGGDAIFYSKEHSTLGYKETYADFGKIASTYAAGIVCRLYEQRNVEEIALSTNKPVINALTNQHHPMQAIGDFMTIFEKKKKFNVTIAYLGDAKNNVTHSLMEAAKLLGAKINIACPPGYEPLKEIYEENKEHTEIFRKPEEAVANADVIYTDSWMSYQISPQLLQKRKKDLAKYQVNAALLAKAHPACLVMHCLPATRNQEITTEVLEGKQSIVFEQAANRLHSTKAVLLKMLR